jgi:hypothetical protein
VGVAPGLSVHVDAVAMLVIGDVRGRGHAGQACTARGGRGALRRWLAELVLAAALAMPGSPGHASRYFKRRTTVVSVTVGSGAGSP